MKKIVLVFLLFTVFSCNQKAKKENEVILDNEELKEIYKADQAGREYVPFPAEEWARLFERDSLRRQRVNELLDSNLVKTSNDFANAAMVFQHGRDTIASRKAVILMKKAVALDSNRNKWLLAAAIDRDLWRRGKLQIYGTQYGKLSLDGPWVLNNYDTTKITDEERLEYGVGTLAEQREKLRRMNKKKLSELLQSGKEVDDIVKLVESSDLENSEYDLSESGINSFGYKLMGEGLKEEALKIFKLNTELFPEGFNTFDSYGECLLELGNKEEAILAYKKSLELNPENKNAEIVIADLTK